MEALLRTFAFSCVVVMNEVSSASGATNNTSSASSGSYAPSLVVSDGTCTPNMTAGPVSGTDLWCYECKEIYVKKYDPLDSPCRHNLSSLMPRRCGPKDRYCKVERLDLHRTVLSLERTCVQDCPYGCKFNGYGLTTMRCISCCNTPACNDGNAASPLHVRGVWTRASGVLGGVGLAFLSRWIMNV